MAIQDMTIREIENKFSQCARLVQNVNLQAANAIADTIGDYLADPVMDYLFGEQELGFPYVSLRTLVAAVLMAETGLPVAISASPDAEPPQAVVAFSDPVRIYCLRESQLECPGQEEAEWLVECKRPEWVEQSA